MRTYEAIFIVQPLLDNEEADKLLDSFVQQIRKDSEVIKTTKWGKKKLAYPIRNYEEGYYYLLNFKTSPKDLGEIERKLRLHDDVIRHLIVKVEEK